MERIVIATYRPKAGKEAALLELNKSHVPYLREQGLATERDVLLLRAADGTLLELFGWRSEEAIEQAHQHPGVLQLWEDFGQVCDFVSLSDLPESGQPFPDFTAVSI